MAYIFTASKASSVRLACKAHFVSLDQESLITISSNTLYIHQPHTLSPSHEITCYGRIASITPFIYRGSKLDQLFITTEDCKYFTLSYIDGHVETSTTGDLSTSYLSSPEIGHRVMANTDYIILYLFSSILCVIPIHTTANAKKRAADGNRLIGVPQQIRLDELKIHGISLVESGADNTLLGILYRDLNLQTHFKTYELAQRKGDIVVNPGSLSMHNLEEGTNIIISCGAQHVCCIGESTLQTVSATQEQRDFPLSTPTLFNSSTKVSRDEWIIGDDYGLLYSLKIAENNTPSLQMINIPEESGSTSPLISIPHVLVALERELFVGSHLGDSQLLSFPELNILARKTNIGPIQDIIVDAPIGSSTSSSLITASGAYKDGSLRFVKYGIGMVDQAELAIDDIRGVWGIDTLHMIAISFVDSYMVLHVSEAGEVSQMFNGDGELLYACSIHNRLVLAQQGNVSIFEDGALISSEVIHSIACVKAYQEALYIIVPAALEVWTLQNSNFTRTHVFSFDHEPSTLEVAYDTIVVGFWRSNKLWVSDLELSNPKEETLEVTNTPHSIILQHFSNMAEPSLLVGMVDGSLLTYTFDQKTRCPRNSKEVALGTTQISLHVFRTPQGPNVFAVCDRPTIIHSARAKLAYSNISLLSCTYFAAFDSDVLHSCMIVATDKGLRIGGIDDIQKLQLSSMTLGELPRRLAKGAGVLAALTMRMVVEQISGNETQNSYLKVYNPDTYDQLDEFMLMENEMCQALCRLDLSRGVECLVVGTSFTGPDSDDSTRGRIIIFTVTGGRLNILCQQEVPGTVFCLECVGTRIIAGVNSFVRMYEVDEDSIKEVSKFRSSTYALTIAVRDDTVLIGDLMKSVTYLRIIDGQLSEIARDYVPMWTTAVQFADQNTFVGAEEQGNLVLFAEAESTLPEDQMRLSRVGEFRYGELINKLVAGTFVVPEDTSIVKPHTIFGTVDGSIGCIGSIAPEYVNLLVMLQTEIGNARPGVGGLKHSEFRGYKTHGTTHVEPVRFVDGDLIEEFLNLTREQQEKICTALDKSIDEMEKMVEDLVRLR